MGQPQKTGMTGRVNTSGSQNGSTTFTGHSLAAYVPCGWNREKGEGSQTFRRKRRACIVEPKSRKLDGKQVKELRERIQKRVDRPIRRTTNTESLDYGWKFTNPNCAKTQQPLKPASG